ncbi:MAG: ATP--guanido phosphotransferase [Actinobacteria bacterium]|nr:MAG: ATP--guanido phosphotransferase [Actinomycetota bacterium]
MSKNNSSIVQTSRIRLARNINGYPFPEWSSSDEQNVVKKIAKTAISKIEGSFAIKELGKTKDCEKNIFVEKNILSSHFLTGDPDLKAFAYNKKSVSIMINEEDHVRLCSQQNGFKLEECWNHLNKVDSALSSEIEYSFSQELGFATACPSNVGTGMRASVMIHTPALCLERKMGKIISKLSDSHITVRGLYGEGSMAIGHIFQISNLNTLGISEIDTIKHLKKVITSIEKKETNARLNVCKKDELLLKDKVRRAIGILKYACFLSYEESLDLLSIIYLGQSLGIENRVKSLMNLAELTKQLRDGHLQKQYSRSRKSIEECRAQKVRQIIT